MHDKELNVDYDLRTNPTLEEQAEFDVLHKRYLSAQAGLDLNRPEDVAILHNRMEKPSLDRYNEMIRTLKVEEKSFEVNTEQFYPGSEIPSPEEQ